MYRTLTAEINMAGNKTASQILQQKSSSVTNTAASASTATGTTASSVAAAAVTAVQQQHRPPRRMSLQEVVVEEQRKAANIQNGGRAFTPLKLAPGSVANQQKQQQQGHQIRRAESFAVGTKVQLPKHNSIATSVSYYILLHTYRVV